ncbi:uncharacterized protein LOC119999121 [Tripterygium wilfordii]|uniref:uncharacterized protein LOC119999121 n=1 Tax=Tripterygium wilfordii TaxID=458696 RepID=UPI0018F83657|nr:uncharacterized protein LOC119999121 [Tripterygium wilfordii]
MSPSKSKKEELATIRPQVPILFFLENLTNLGLRITIFVFFPFQSTNYNFVFLQPYKSNKRLVISLSPLPHCGTSSNNGSTCRTCERRLAEPDQFNYCSISCKVTALSEKKACDSSPPFPQNSSLEDVQRKKDSRPETCKRKRKGTPRRAPFF